MQGFKFFSLFNFILSLRISSQVLDDSISNKVHINKNFKNVYLQYNAYQTFHNRFGITFADANFGLHSDFTIENFLYY